MPGTPLTQTNSDVSDELYDDLYPILSMGFENPSAPSLPNDVVSPSYPSPYEDYFFADDPSPVSSYAELLRDTISPIANHITAEKSLQISYKSSLHPFKAIFLGDNVSFHTKIQHKENCYFIELQYLGTEQVIQESLRNLRYTLTKRFNSDYNLRFYFDDNHLFMKIAKHLYDQENWLFISRTLESECNGKRKYSLYQEPQQTPAAMPNEISLSYHGNQIVIFHAQIDRHDPLKVDLIPKNDLINQNYSNLISSLRVRLKKCNIEMLYKNKISLKKTKHKNGIYIRFANEDALKDPTSWAIIEEIFLNPNIASESKSESLPKRYLKKHKSEKTADSNVSSDTSDAGLKTTPTFLLQHSLFSRSQPSSEDLNQQPTTADNTPQMSYRCRAEQSEG